MALPELTNAELTESRKLLLRSVHIQLPDRPDLAEDFVQETTLSTYRAAESFKGGARVSSWPFTILKNKITDCLRRIGRQRQVSATHDEEALDETFEGYFATDEHWTDEGQSQGWDSPEASLNNKELYQVLQTCLYHLPENTARVSTMKEILGFPSDEIHEQCGTSHANYHTIMHRARETLRQCLQIKWFSHV